MMRAPFDYVVRTDNAVLRSHARRSECVEYLKQLTITGRPGKEMGAYVARYTTANDRYIP